jgi:hypothetical protein
MRFINEILEMAVLGILLLWVLGPFLLHMPIKFDASMLPPEGQAGIPVTLHFALKRVD